MPTGQLSDEILVAQVACGDRSALEILYEHYAPTILGISLKILGDRAAAEDVLQETFWRVWQSAVTYQTQRGSVTAWLFGIARNLAIDAYRRRKVRPQTTTKTTDTDVILDRMPDLTVDVAEQVQSNLRHERLRNALRNLPPGQLQVIEMAYFYGMTRQQISEATGEALGTIHTRARLGLHKLREELEKAKIEF